LEVISGLRLVVLSLLVVLPILAITVMERGVMRRDLRGVLEQLFFLARNTWRPSSSP
jgi:hypothetical protein